MALMEITVIPLGTGSTSVGDYIADIKQYLHDKNVEHSMHDMGTVIAGTTEELLQLAREIHLIPFTKGAERNNKQYYLGRETRPGQKAR